MFDKVDIKKGIRWSSILAASANLLLIIKLIQFPSDTQVSRFHSDTLLKTRLLGCLPN